MNLALGRVQENPFSENDIQNLKEDVIDELERASLELKRGENDKRDAPIDFRYLDLLLKAAEDPEVGLGQSSHKVSVSDLRSGCRASQHFTSRRESGG